MANINSYCGSTGCLNRISVQGSRYCTKCALEINAVTGIEQMKVAVKPKEETKEFSGGDNNYWLLNITDPKRLAPYQVECEDIIEALEMTFAEGTILKALWRSCNLRANGNGKRGQDDAGIYDGDKIEYYGNRVKAQRHRKATK